ncbi:magnesium/cobalt transporter CorA [Akkermansiaceae bacterium]|nr:magnesium/cobalt transporter CorA [Akkermansiaceae bacterium]
MILKENIGGAPSILTHIGEKRVNEVSLKLTHYSPDGVTTESVNHLPDLSKAHESKLAWLDISGLHQPEIVGEACAILDVHTLAAQDILNTLSCAKVDDLGDTILFIAKLPSRAKETNALEIKQVSFLIKEGRLITFTEDEDEFFQPIYSRLRKKTSRILTSPISYLAWSVLDLIVDYTLHFLQTIEDDIERLDTEISEQNTLPEVCEIHGVRREIAMIQRAIRPMQDIVNMIEKNESELLSESTAPYFKELRGHVSQAVEQTEFLREHISSVRELYYTLTNQRMNEAMKMMAALSAIFLPLSFIAGVYGMNFASMPELQWKWGYPLVICLFILISSCLVILFKKRDWF